ncbi:DNA primase, large subunit, putative [Eimeria maxima]|uniref:DNA primase, large subunit, putative n=1 Tax=Eimeria maxima TaxID=5804 RepID=U6M4Q5_EIMMA|nr:DNA primase, large subunit, putative [Eimeria maxima]CDJ59207.1 DNA primase, large subunit, putative [Eimeria maxima]
MQLALQAKIDCSSCSSSSTAAAAAAAAAALEVGAECSYGFMTMPYPSRPAEAHRPLSLLGRFPHPVGVYGQHPPAIVTQVDSFESATAHRLRVLHFLDEKFGLDSSTNPSVLRAASSTPAAAAVAAGNDAGAGAKPLYIQLEEMLQEGGLMLPLAAAATATEQQRREVAERDAMSHFALRVAFSRDRDKQRWLVLQESRLFMYRFDRLCAFRGLEDGSQSLLSNFLQQEGLNYACIQRPRDPVAGSALDKLWKTATGFFRANLAQQVQHLYLVPCFPDAGPLVRNRRVYIQNMMAYVPEFELGTVICGRLRTAMNNSFELLEGRQATLQNTILSDSRVGKLLSAAPNVYLGRDFNNNAVKSTEERLTPQLIKQVFKDSFPPCMRRLYESYLAEHHLRHGGRMQLWLFFKGAGMTLEENLQFNRQMWREPQKFEKEHAYNIRHMYGLEGKRANYAPLRCDDVGNHPNAFFAASRRFSAATAAGGPAAAAAAAEKAKQAAAAEEAGTQDTEMLP